jgi:hypothetical protein
MNCHSIGYRYQRFLKQLPDDWLKIVTVNQQWIYRVRTIISDRPLNEVRNLCHSRSNSSLSRNADDDDSSASQVPIDRPHNRMTVIYSQMQRVCPDDIKAYATCVQQANDSDENEIGLTKGCCESEFQKVKDCFRRVRYQN